jgi:hypothetical protein
LTFSKHPEKDVRMAIKPEKKITFFIEFRFSLVVLKIV